MANTKISHVGKIRMVTTTTKVQQPNGEVREHTEMHVPEGDEAHQDFLRYLERKLPGMTKLSKKPRN